jgi:hypothetical protein
VRGAFSPYLMWRLSPADKQDKTGAALAGMAAGRSTRNRQASNGATARGRHGDIYYAGSGVVAEIYDSTSESNTRYNNLGGGGREHLSAVLGVGERWF